MCGFSVYVGPDEISLDLLRASSESLAHRGPDAAARYVHKGDRHSIALVHRRLAILDLDKKSTQPFRIGTKILAFNGEIYNFIELKKELELEGHSFTTPGRYGRSWLRL